MLFAIENSLLSVEVPPKEGLPHADVSLLAFVFLRVFPVRVSHWMVASGLTIFYLMTDIISAFASVFGCGQCYPIIYSCSTREKDFASIEHVYPIALTPGEP